MHVLDPGHAYRLLTLDCGPLTRGEYLTFVKRQGPRYPGNVGSHAGTTLQEVLRACLDRCFYVNSQEFSFFTLAVAVLLGHAIWLLEARAARRHSRRIPRVKQAVAGELCVSCGHASRTGRLTTSGLGADHADCINKSVYNLP